MSLQRTPLHTLHAEYGARMVPFAGFEMPLHYPAGIIHEHRHTRQAAGLFDLSHMGQIEVKGDSAASDLEALVPSLITNLSIGRQRYTVMTAANGGIVDDLIVTRFGDRLWLVVNAARTAIDLAHLNQRLSGRCRVTHLAQKAMLALQGPDSAAVMERLRSGTGSMPFLSARSVEIDGAECLLTRSGYTGEDGFEISLSAADVERLARRLLAEPEVAPVGLGARDSLRLEAGLCLYGADIDETTTPVEAGLGWVVASAYRSGARPARFPGSELILELLRQGPARRRVGFKPAGKAPVRAGAQLRNQASRPVGHVTSGGYSPGLAAPIAMGYVESAFTATGTELITDRSGRDYPLHVTALPFVPHRYRRD